MGQIEDLSADFQSAWLTMDDDAALFLQIIQHPHVVITAEIVHLHTQVSQFADFAQETGIAPGHHLLILEPEVEHVAHHINSLSLLLDLVEEIDQTPLLCASVLDGTASQMGIADKVYILHI